MRYCLRFLSCVLESRHMWNQQLTEQVFQSSRTCWGCAFSHTGPPTHPHKQVLGHNPVHAFECFSLREGLTQQEDKKVREGLLACVSTSVLAAEPTAAHLRICCHDGCMWELLKLHALLLEGGNDVLL